jgi:type VI secretion system secreted protein VgrG
VTGYANDFRAIPAATPFRPPRVAPRPRVDGVLTGIVEAADAASASKHAHLDDRGRYVVRLLFDPTPPGERPASRPLRMAQAHAGASFGIHFPLKPGVEVLVAFVDGDPDRPVIVGAVPNALTPSPVDARNPTLHRIKTGDGILIELSEGS